MQYRHQMLIIFLLSDRDHSYFHLQLHNWTKNKKKTRMLKVEDRPSEFHCSSLILLPQSALLNVWKALPEGLQNQPQLPSTIAAGLRELVHSTLSIFDLASVAVLRQIQIHSAYESQHSDFFCFLQSSCQQHIYASNSEKCAEQQHADGWAEKKVQCCRGHRNTAYSHKQSLLKEPQEKYLRCVYTDSSPSPRQIYPFARYLVACLAPCLT